MAAGGAPWSLSGLRNRVVPAARRGRGERRRGGRRIVWSEPVAACQAAPVCGRYGLFTATTAIAEAFAATAAPETAVLEPSRNIAPGMDVAVVVQRPGPARGGRRCRFRAYRLHSPSACGALGTPPILGHRSRCRLPRLQRPLGDGGRQADLPRGHALVPRRRTRLMLVRVARPGSRARIRGVAHRRTALCRAPGRRQSARARRPVLVVACARASVRVGARGARTSRLVVADPDRSHP